MIFKKNGKRIVKVSTVARILTINRSISPAAKLKIPEWFRETALPCIININSSGINSSRIFRELAVIENHKDSICKYIFEQLTRSDPASMNSIFYDFSSSSFEGTKCKLMKWGHCKGGYELVSRKFSPIYTNTG